MIKPVLFKLISPAALICMFVCTPAAKADTYLGQGHSFFQSTYLIEATQNTSLSLKARALRHGGYETAKGDWVAFNDWYFTSWKDTRLSWMTQLTPNFGLVWGLSTGERAKKHVIDPGLRVGFIFQSELGKKSHISFSFTSVLGGLLKEKSCTADYGEMAGVQQVNCRLAASELEPSETLKHMINERPKSVGQLRYQISF